MLFTHPDIVPKLHDIYIYDFKICMTYFEKCITMESVVRRTVWFFRRKKVTLFGMTQKRMNDDRDLIELNYI